MSMSQIIFNSSAGIGVLISQTLTVCCKTLRFFKRDLLPHVQKAKPIAFPPASGGCALFAHHLVPRLNVRLCYSRRDGDVRKIEQKLGVSLGHEIQHPNED